MCFNDLNIWRNYVINKYITAVFAMSIKNNERIIY